MDAQTLEAYVITTVIAVASAIVAFLSFYYNNKMNKLNSLVKAFEILNNNAHRNARIRLYRAAEIPNENAKDAHLRALGVKDEALITIIKESENIVLADFDQMGTLVKNNLLPVDEFLKVYWNTIISTYEIRYTNDKRDLYKDFEFLYTKAKKVRDEKDPDKHIPLEKEIYREKLEVKVQCNQQIDIVKTQTISVTVRDPFLHCGSVSNAEVYVKVSDKESKPISLDTQKTDKYGNAEIQLSVTDSYFKVGKMYNVKAIVLAKGYRNSESEDNVFFTVNNFQYLKSMGDIF
jgi:hypothetical protein